MKAVLILLLFALAYSIPNPVYTIKDCFEKLYTPTNSEVDNMLSSSVENELLNWKVEEFYEKLNAVDPTLRPKIEECVEEVNKKFDFNGVP